MKKIQGIIAAAIIQLSMMGVNQAQTVNITGGDATSNTDLLQGALTTGSSGLYQDATYQDSTPSGIFGGLGTFNGNSTFFENGIPVNYMDFETAAPITFSQIVLSLNNDTGSNIRAISGYSLYARSTAGTFTAGDIVSSASVNSDYLGTYGNNLIAVTDTFNSYKTAQYFRLSLNSADAFGPKVLELDAFNVTPVPEPSTYLFIGLGLLLVFIVRNQSRQNY